MSLLPLRFLFFPLLTIASSLHAFDWSDPLPKGKTSEFWDLSGNGLVTYVEENRTIASCGSIRVVLKNNPFPSEIFAFELTPSNWHELSSFFDACKQRLNSSEHSLAIVAVGDFVESHIRALCQEPFASFVFTSSVSQKEPFLLIPAPISDVVVALNYCNSLQPISSLGDLYQRWIDIVLENVVQKRLSKIAQAQGLNLTYDHSDSFYPMDSCFIHITASNKSYLKVLFTLLEELEQIKQEGFSEGEITEIKQQLLAGLEHHQRNRQVIPNVELANFYADQMVYHTESLDFDLFLKLSQRLISHISNEDLFLRAGSYFNNSNRFIKVFYPSQKEGVVIARDIDKVLSRFQTATEISLQANYPKENEIFTDLLRDEEDPTTAATAAVQEKAVANPLPHEPYSFFQLPLSDEEKKIISKIITTMMEKNVVQLTFAQKSLEKKGDQIEHVHPLRFIGYVFSEPRLKTGMKAVRRSIFKWNGFLKGFSRRMKEEHHKDNLLPHVPGLCQSLGIPTEEVTRYIKEKNWEGLVRYLISN